MIGRDYRISNRHKKSSNFKLVFLLILLFGLGVIIFFHSKTNQQNLASPAAPPIVKTPLGTVIDKELQGSRGTYGLVVKNFKTNESYNVGEHNVFEAGSLYKLWIMATVYKQIQDGELSKDQELSEDISNLNDIFNIDQDSAELTDGTITLTVKSALTQMITISHNYAALLLTEEVKLSSVSSFLKNNGFTESIVGVNGNAPMTTASDIALFFEKLYKGELVNPQYTVEMVETLKKQQLNDGLPKYLLEPVAVSHKTGDIGWFKHDAGIVYGPNGDYIIVVMSESDSPISAQERIALLSKAVYDYFQPH